MCSWLALYDAAYPLLVAAARAPYTKKPGARKAAPGKFWRRKRPVAGSHGGSVRLG